MSNAPHSRGPDERPGRYFDFAVPEGVALVVLDADADTTPLLHPAEEALLHPRATATRRKDFRRGRHAAHLALRALEVSNGPVLRGEHREPLWPEEVVGSISHSSGIALAGVARRRDCAGIGLDVEHHSRFFPGLAKAIAFDEERSWLSSLDPAAQRRATLELFSAKESVYKALFPTVGRYFGFSAARIAPHPRSECLLATLREPIRSAAGAPQTLEVQVSWAGEHVATALFLPPPNPKDSFR